MFFVQSLGLIAQLPKLTMLTIKYKKANICLSQVTLGAVSVRSLSSLWDNIGGTCPSTFLVFILP